MNLIEHLGGYEKAKSIRDINIIEFDGDASGVTIHYMGNSITQEDLEKALLEYRRQHNIFEVGDEVVSKNGCELVSEITYLQGGLAKIKNEKFDHVYSLQDFRHATPEEIKAGRRL